MTIQGISDNVQALLVDTGKFVTVLDWEPEKTSDFAGYPAASHYYVDTENDYATVSQNRRVIEYLVQIVLMGDEDTTPSDLKTQMYGLMDDIVQMFDETRDLSSSSPSLARACDIMRPAPGNLTKIVTNEGAGLLGEIRLYCEKDVTFRN